ncbi:unnamed protein product [Dovyalis caffra]|uniref:Uncharacterized protein n=1 Tax=Dovyalis caffra TaxID=77055 RepID=A0AAV1RHB1_9ROSI|nr:unnamed protein product [Dovyalis caffra]
MLSQKKRRVAESSIDFRGITLYNGEITLQPHIASKLKDFSDSYLPKNIPFSRTPNYEIQASYNYTFAKTPWKEYRSSGLRINWLPIL